MPSQTVPVPHASPPPSVNGGAPDSALRAIAWPLAMTLLAQVIASWANLTVPVFAVRLADGIGVSATWIGVYVSLTYFSAMISSVLCGPLILRYGAIRISQACLLIAACSLALLTASTLPLAIVSALVMGIAYGPTTPASSHILSAQTPPKLMPLIFSLKQTGVPLGGMLAGAAVPPLVLLYDWQGAAWIVAGFALAGIFVLQPLRGRLDAERDPAQPLLVNPLRSIGMVWRAPGLRRMALLSMAFSAVQMCLLSYLVTYMVVEVGRDLVTAGLILAAAQMAGVGGRILWGGVSGLLLTARQVLMLLGLLMAICGAVMALVSPTWPLVGLFALAALYGATAISWNGVQLAELSRLSPPGQAVMATGGSLFFTFTGVMLGPTLFGVWVTATGSYSAGFFALAALGLIGAALLVKRYE
ncbi:MAG: MFS transporter [Alphaproteobacteria bacterium]